MTLGRRSVGILVLSALLPVSACVGTGGSGADEAPAVAERFEPLRYDYLTPIGLNVGAVTVERRRAPASTPPAEASEPTTLDAAIRAMAEDRLRAVGTTGRAVLAIDDASISRVGDGYQGAAAVELDIYTPADERVAFVEARVTAHRSNVGGDRRARYELTKQLMDQLNVELEYQMRHHLGDWIVNPTTGPPAPVEQQALPAP